MYKHLFLFALALTASLLISNRAMATPQFNDGRDTYQRYAKGLFKHYDVDNDNFLDQSELDQMRQPPKNADRNGDRRISMEELIQSITKETEKRNTNSTQANTAPVTRTASLRIELLLLDSDVPIADLADRVSKLNGSTKSNRGTISGGGLFGDLVVGAKGEISGGLLAGDPELINQLLGGSKSSKSVDKQIAELKQLGKMKSVDFCFTPVTSGRPCVLKTNINDPYKRSEFDMDLELSPVVFDDSVEIELTITKTLPIDLGTDKKSEQTDEQSIRINLSTKDKDRILERISELELYGQIRLQVSDDNKSIILTGSKKDVDQIREFVAHLSTATQKANEQRERQQRNLAQNINPSVTRSLRIHNTLTCKFGHATVMMLTESDQHWVLILRADE